MLTNHREQIKTEQITQNQMPRQQTKTDKNKWDQITAIDSSSAESHRSFQLSSNALRRHSRKLDHFDCSLLDQLLLLTWTGHEVHVLPGMFIAMATGHHPTCVFRQKKHLILYLVRLYQPIINSQSINQCNIFCYYITEKKTSHIVSHKSHKGCGSDYSKIMCKFLLRRVFAMS